MNVEFTVPGHPFGKQRHRTHIIKSKTGKFFATHYTPKETRTYEQDVVDAYLKATNGIKMLRNDMNVFISITAYHPIPKASPKWFVAMCNKTPVDCPKRPEWDNIAKVICDALIGVAYHDDNAITTGIVSKYYSNTPCVKVSIKYNERTTKQQWLDMEAEIEDGSQPTPF